MKFILSQVYDTAVKADQKIGVCVIVNLDEDKRSGSEYDVTYLKNLFEKLNFRVNETKANEVIGIFKE